MIPAEHVQPQQTLNEQETSFNETTATSSNDHSLQMVVFSENSNNIQEPESLENQVAVTFPNSTVNQLVSEWSGSDCWSTSTDSHGRQDQLVEYTPNRTNQLSIPNDNGPKFVNTFSGNKDLHNNFIDKRTYKGPVTIHQNVYCCPSTLCNGLKSKRCIAGVIATLVGILIIIYLSVWFLNTSITKEHKFSINITSTTTDAGDLLYLDEDLVPTVSSGTVINIDKRVLPNKSTTVPNGDYSSSTQGKKKEKNETIIENKTLKIITRDEWDASPPKKPPVKLAVLPAARVIISETSTESCDQLEKCMRIVRNIQRSHFGLMYPDIAYNFLVSTDGLIYEGRGWDMQGNVAYHFKHESISIAFIGNFTSIVPSENQVRAALKLIQFGVENGNISMFFILKGEKQLKIFNDNPGDKLYNIITKWQQWEPGIDFGKPTEEHNESMSYIKLFSGTKFTFLPKRGRN